MIKLAVENNIELFCLPPHTTHKLQPLDVGAFGPLQRAWSRQCDNYLARTGKVMEKKHVVREYMQARDQSFSANTISQAWAKCGIAWKEGDSQKLRGVDVFSDADFAPSRNTSVFAPVPSSFPKQLPSDYEPWPGSEPVEEEVMESQPTITRSEFEKDWERTDGSMDCDEGDDSMDEDEDSSDEGSEKGSPDDNEEDEDEDEDEDDGGGENEWQGIQQVMVNGQEAQTSVAMNDTHVHHDQQFLAGACDASLTQSGIASTSSPSPSGAATSSSASTPSAISHLQAPRRSRNSAESRRLNTLLFPVSFSSTNKEELFQQNVRLQAELHSIRKQRNTAETHAIMAEAELARLQTQINSNKGKKKGKVKVTNSVLLTSAESRERREVEATERRAKEKKKADAKAAKAVRAAENQVRRTQIQNNAGHAFSGSLASKNKSELEDIIVAVGLATGRKAEMIQRIQDYFKYHPEDAKSARYSGLFSSARRGRRAAPPPITIDEIEDPHPPFDAQPLPPNQDAGPSHIPAQNPPPLRYETNYPFPQYQYYVHPPHPPQPTFTPNHNVYTHNYYHTPYSYNT